jgi:lysophospholipase L1-like esterase
MTGLKVSSVEIVYPKPVLTGGAAPIQSSCVPRQGTAFPLGTTVVDCATTDSEARQATCSFTVTLTRSVLGAQRFVAFGDSITEGSDGLGVTIVPSAIDPTKSYPTALRALFQTEFPGQGITVVNDGKSGEPAGCGFFETSCGVLRLPSSIATHRPQALLLLDGYNDLNDPGNVNRVVTAMRDMIRIARGAGVSYVFVGTMTPGRKSDPGFLDRQRLPAEILAVNAMLATMVPAEGAHLVNTYAAFLGRELTLVGPDGLHLTAAGNTMLAETFFARIRQIIPTSEQAAGVLQ